MSDQFGVLTDELRTHAASIDAIRDRFAAVLSAIDSIAQDDQAYGVLCQFLPPTLEDRQNEQKELTAIAQENFELLAEAVRGTADDYDAVDEAVADSYRAIQDLL
ncbi:type VII secretion target [Glycomyces dulcitolivorans]|uniref:type VII secretion target n=1 Tax=Glycomyces dulcitolivorans TaxID=2200759 RepID=UPI00130052B0|nr:type VII secretion target [Glycomyces dulcitolivorans]